MGGRRKPRLVLRLRHRHRCRQCLRWCDALISCGTSMLRVAPCMRVRAGLRSCLRLLRAGTLLRRLWLRRRQHLRRRLVLLRRRQETDIPKNEVGSSSGSGVGVWWLLFFAVILIVVVACQTPYPSDTDSRDGGGELSEDDEYRPEPLTPNPPCLAVDADVDPCPASILPFVETFNVHTVTPPYLEDVPSVSEILAGLYSEVLPIVTPHIVARVSILPGTTRCEIYRVIDYGFEGGKVYRYLYRYLCFADVQVNEYYIGGGPARLTISVFGEPVILGSGVEPSDISLDRHLGSPKLRTARAYEGREVVMFLRPTLTMAVESWAVEGTYDLWYLRRESGSQEGTTSGSAVAAGSATASTGIKAGWRYGTQVVAEMDLDELARLLRSLAPPLPAQGSEDLGGSAENSTSTTSGSSTSVPSMPPLVRRSDQLRDFYVASGAVYEGEGRTTVLPPPAPGGDTTTTTVVEETTTTSSEASTTTSSTTSSTTTSSTTQGTTTTTEATTTTTEATTTTTTTLPSTGVPGPPTNVAVSDALVVSWDPPTTGGPVSFYYIRVGTATFVSAGRTATSRNISRWVPEGQESTIRIEIAAYNNHGNSTWVVVPRATATAGA